MYLEYISGSLPEDLQPVLDCPTIWKFITSLKKIQKGRDTYYEQLVVGHMPRHKLLKYVRADERILRIVNQFHQRDPVEYMRGLAHNYEFS